MGLLIAGLIALLVPLAASAQQAQEPFQEAGACARCHVISVVEWGMSGHRKAATRCTSCHGASAGHVQDERNNVKPERVPAGVAISGLCAECHKDGCPKSGKQTECQTCHHYHALVNPQKPAVTGGLSAGETRWQEFSRLMREGERLAGAGRWEQARTAFEAALRQQPRNRRAAERLDFCDRRLKPDLPGFEILDKEFDPATGLARTVKVAGFGIPMVLAPGGEFEMGSDRYKTAKPVHTVRVRPFYLGQFEITQAEWTKVMGANPSAHQGDEYPDASRMPVEEVSWEDAQVFVKRLNEKVPGGGFRLPTEAEWEYAARAGAAEPEAPAAGQHGPHAVDRSGPDRLGLHDMLGNVWEWCSSLDRPYPFDAADGRESSDGSGLRVLRGGGYADPLDLLDPALRHTERPARRFPYNGLRLARGVPDSH